ncbi:MAG: hypothetical protein Q9182_001371 [Xanthomendoza sp. 2 TL-2023]
MSGSGKLVHVASDASLGDSSRSTTPTKISAAFALNHVTKDLHPALSDPSIRYDTRHDCFAAELEGIYDEATLFDSQRAFADALEELQRGVRPKYESRIDLVARHNWDEVIECANEARNSRACHRSVAETSAINVNLWLGRVWGGLTLILELRKETLNALDQIPLCVENAQHLIQTYGYPQVKQQVAKLYVAISSVLQHILGWYERAAGLKYLSAFWRGPAYAEKLKAKMKELQIASQDMGERGTQSGQLRLKEIQDVALYTRDQVDDLKILALEARNHLYAVFKDTELWQEALQSWKESRLAKRSGRTSEDQAHMKEGKAAARQLLLARFGPDYDDPIHDMEVVLGQLTSMLLSDQDRGLNLQDPKKLLKLFRRLLRDSSHSGPIICILDGLSWYEGRHQRDDLGKIIRELSSLANASPPQLILFLTSPTRTTFIAQEPTIAQNLMVTDVPAHIDGLKQGVSCDLIMSSTTSMARKMSESFRSASIKA